MKFFVKIFTFLFFIFLLTPSVLSVVEGKEKIAFYYDLEEEENQQEIKFLSIPLSIAKIDCFNFSTHSIALIAFDNKFKHDYFFSSVFSPPPDL
jgi:hypothetical protein